MSRGAVVWSRGMILNYSLGEDVNESPTRHQEIQETHENFRNNSKKGNHENTSYNNHYNLHLTRNKQRKQNKKKFIINKRNTRT